MEDKKELKAADARYKDLETKLEAALKSTDAVQLDSSSSSSGVVGYSVAAAALAGVAGYVGYNKRNQKTEEDAFRGLY